MAEENEQLNAEINTETVGATVQSGSDVQATTAPETPGVTDEQVLNPYILKEGTGDNMAATIEQAIPANKSPESSSNATAPGTGPAEQTKPVEPETVRAEVIPQDNFKMDPVAIVMIVLALVLIVWAAIRMSKPAA